MGLKTVKILIADVDGTLTDGTVYVGEKTEFVGFDIQDGLGHRLAACGGLAVGWLSGRISKPVSRRAKRLNVSFLYQGQLDKLAAARRVCRLKKVSLAQVAYMGDDLIDIPLLKAVGFSAAPSNARPEVKRVCDYVAKASGGKGAFREVVEKILKSQGRWPGTIAKYHSLNKTFHPY
jgi:3-deoxy-D-manno-octulosonate 8-phosphate phosphatase (KDO 8-P phosphatase)